MGSVEFVERVALDSGTDSFVFYRTRDKLGGRRTNLKGMGP
ncbi:hypothetical protein I552_9864 [Mycobacterium xenopi 3993]|nr:hypothetical protein I552_9864 [Mycobacterium xenopi 3993]